MKKKKMDGFLFFVLVLFAMAVFFFIQLLAGMQEEKKQYTALVSLGALRYDEDFLKKAAKIKGIKEIWPVVEIPVNIKIEDYTEETTFLGIDFNAFGSNPDQENLGNTPMLLLGTSALQNMKDSNGHSISNKQQEKYLKQGEDLNISYQMTEGNEEGSASSNSSFSYTDSHIQKNAYLPCKVVSVSEKEKDTIYIPFSQAQKLCQENDVQLDITKVFLKINGKRNLERAKQLFES